MTEKSDLNSIEIKEDPNCPPNKIFVMPQERNIPYIEESPPYAQNPTVNTAVFCGQIDQPHHWVSHSVRDSIIRWVEICSICKTINGKYLDKQFSQHLITLLIGELDD